MYGNRLLPLVSLVETNVQMKRCDTVSDDYLGHPVIIFM